MYKLPLYLKEFSNEAVMISILNRISFRRFLLVAVFAMGGGYNTLGQSYCKPSLGSCCEWISNVSLGSIDHSTTNESGYADYTNISTVVAKGVTYPINIKVSNNSVYVEHVKVYFDWDRDYIFETTLYLGSAKFTGNNVFSGEITVPDTAKNGCSMMRVFMQYAQQPSGACSSLGDGEIEDYAVVVSNTSAPVADFTFPSSQACVQSSIPFTNSSSISEDVIMSYRWNFGDGTTSTAANPTKKFATARNYDVKLTTSTFCTSHTVTKTITIGNYPAITLQPVSTAICSGTNTSFTVNANSGSTFKWQVNKGSGFIDIIDGGFYSQSTTSSLIITAATIGMNGYQYRCLVSTSCTVTSSAATLTIQEPPVISSNPADASVCVGGNVTFSLTATGSGLSYQWQQNSGQGFTNLTNAGAFSNVTSRTLSISGITEAYHNYNYRCVVNGVCSSTSTAVALSINVGPAITSHPTDATVLEGTNASFRMEASGTGVTYQWQENSGSGFVNLTNNEDYNNVTSATLVVIETPLSKTGYRYRCLVSTNCTTTLLASEPAVLTVQSRVPTITSTALTTIREDLPYSYTIRATDATGNPLTYSALVKPDWLSLDPSTGVLSGTPSNGDVGIHAITLRVSNGSMNADQIFTITVSNSNDRPIINSGPLTVVKEDEVYSYTLVASDIDEGSVLSYSAPIKPSWLTFTPDTRVLHGTPTNNDVGIHEVTLRVADDSLSADQSFSITVMNVNDVPVITSIPIVYVDEDSSYSYTVSGDDVDSLDAVLFSSPVKPSWLTFDEMSGVLKGIPSNSEVGSHQVTLRASDGHVKVDQSFTIIVKNVNDAPIITSQPVITTYEDDEYNYILAALDDDRDTFLSFVVLEKPVWLSFDTGKHLLHGTPTNKDVGSHVIRLQVTDGIVDINQSFSLTVINVNDAPIITSAAEISIEEGINYNYVLTAVDADAEDVLRYAAVTKPGWLTFNTNNGILNGTPQKNDIGVHNITLRVNDGSVEVDQSFTVSVTTVDEPVPGSNFKPTQLTFSTKTFESTVSVNEALGSFTTVDVDDTDHIYTLVIGDGDLNNKLFSVEGNKLYLVSQTFPEAMQFSIRVKSTDAHGNFIEEKFQLEKVVSNLWDIQIPTTFSPDGDGVNDTWVIKDLKQFKDVSVQVFDRSGVSLYASNDPEQGWDGSVQGGRILEGPFFYIVKIHDKLAIRKGVLIVIR